MDLLRRYTSLPFLLHSLRTGKLVLGDPAKWDDKNDSAIIEAYRKKRKIKKVYALCFAECSETYHHWKIYGDGPSGVCIEFDKRGLLDTLMADGLRKGKVQYCRIDKLADHSGKVDSWPFLKRLPFKGEEEYRVILDYAGDLEIPVHTIPFDIHSINRIFLSPWLSREVIRTIEVIIHGIPGCEEIIVKRTGLVDHSNWKSVFAPEE